MPADQGPKWSQQLSLPPDVTSPSRARDFVRTQLNTHGPASLVDDVELVVSELATNAVVHAGTPLLVILEGDGLTVLLTVRDNSTGFAPRTRLTSTADTEGRGLLITDMVSDDWGVDVASTKAKSIWASFSTAARP